MVLEGILWMITNLEDDKTEYTWNGSIILFPIIKMSDGYETCKCKHIIPL